MQQAELLCAPPQISAHHDDDTDHPGRDFLSPADWIQVGSLLRLSQRELVIAVLIFEGKKRASIGRQLGLSAGTVRVYIDRLFDKLNVEDRLGMVLRIVRVHVKHAYPGKSLVAQRCDL